MIRDPFIVERDKKTTAEMLLITDPFVTDRHKKCC